MRSKSPILVATIAFFGFEVHAQVPLGTAGDFAVLGGSAVNNTGPTVVEGGHVGVSPGSAIVGFPPGIVVPPYTIHAADAVALQAQSDLTIAYNNAAGLAPTQNLTGQDLGGQTLTPGVYFFASSAQLTGTLTLDAQGDPDAEFVFQIGSTLTTASNSSVVLINGAQACNVFWQVGSSATLGSNTTFVGNILALTSITLVTGVDVDGRLLARNGAVTLDSNNISAANCVDCFLDADCPPEAPFCDPVTGVCAECVTNGNCDDGLFCNGPETCVAGECQPGSDPCLPLACDEATGTCNLCPASSCPPAAPVCDPATGLCVECLADGDCDDQEICTGDTCNPTTHECEYACTDETDPIGDCGDTDISVSCDEPVPPYFPTFTDNCDSALIYDFVTTDSAGACPQEHTIQQSVTATDICGNATTCTRTVRVTTPIITCPPDITLSRGDKICSDDVQEWLDSATVTNACGELVNDAPECGFPYGSTTTVTWTVDDGCDNEIPCSAVITIGPAPRVDNDKGSVIIFTKVDLRWNAAGVLTQDTFLTLTNDFPDDVHVQLYFVNGDAAREPVFSSGPAPFLIADGEPGWNWVDCQVLLTPDQPLYWSASTGSPLGCQPFTILDPAGPGRPDPESNDGTRVLRGFVVAFAVNQAGAEIQWNHLSGKATIVDYANMTAWEYDAFAFQATCTAQGEEPLDCTLFDEQGVCCAAEVIPGSLGTDGFQYDYAFDALLLDFFGVGSQALSGGSTPITVDTDLTLHILSGDLRQETDGPVTTKAHFDIWNMNERKLSNTRRCLTCWDQTLLSSYGAPNTFLVENLQSDKGKARIQGLRANECELHCFRDTNGDPLEIEDLLDLLGDFFNGIDVVCSQDAALLGVAAKYLVFSGAAGQRATAGSTLVGMGTERALIQYDVVDPPGTLREESYERIERESPRAPEEFKPGKVSRSSR